MPNISYRNYLRANWRFVQFSCHIVWAVMYIFIGFSRMHFDKRQKWLQKWSQKLLQILAIKVVCEGVNESKKDASFWVSNHVTWLDIFVYMSIEPSRFVAKDEIAQWPVVGRLVASFGVVFIDRNNKHHAREVSQQLVEYLNVGEAVTVFPEGTSSDGTSVLPFKSSLFQAALESGAAVQPWALRYENEHGRQVTHLAYYGEVSFWESLKPLLLNRQNQVRVAKLPMVAVGDKERRVLCEESRNSVVAQLKKWAVTLD